MNLSRFNKVRMLPETLSGMSLAHIHVAFVRAVVPAVRFPVCLVPEDPVALLALIDFQQWNNALCELNPVYVNIMTIKECGFGGIRTHDILTQMD